MISVGNAAEAATPVEGASLSPAAVPSEKGLSIGKTAVFPVLHTPYDYDEGF